MIAGIAYYVFYPQCDLAYFIFIVDVWYSRAYSPGQKLPVSLSVCVLTRVAQMITAKHRDL